MTTTQPLPARTAYEKTRTEREAVKIIAFEEHYKSRAIEEAHARFSRLISRHCPAWHGTRPSSNTCGSYMAQMAQRRSLAIGRGS